MKKKLENKQCNNKETSTPSKDAHNSRSSKGKAIARVKKRNLPCSPRKRRAILKELAWEQIKIKPFAPVKKRSYSSLCTKDKKSVIDFFSRDDISRQAPGKTWCGQNKIRWWLKDRKAEATPGSICCGGLIYGSQKIQHEKYGNLHFQAFDQNMCC